MKVSRAAGLSVKYPPKELTKLGDFTTRVNKKIDISGFFAAVGGRRWRNLLPSRKTLLYAKVCICVREIRIVAFPHPEAPSLSILRMRKYKSAMCLRSLA